MKLTKVQQRYAGVLLIGVSALTVDKMFLSPQEASASVPTNSAAIDATEPASFEIASNVDFKAQLVGRISSQGVDATLVPDLFRVPDAWSTDARASFDQDAGAIPDPHVLFAQRRTLNAVAQHEGGGMAIVDSVVVRVGAQLHGFTLTRVGSRSAVFHRDGRDVVLELSDELDSSAVEITSRDSSSI